MKQALVVEDDDLFAGALRRVLEQEGYQAAIFASVRAGAEWLAAHNPVLMLLDYHVLDGVGWVLREKAPPGCRVIRMTALVQPEDPPDYPKMGDVCLLRRLIRGEGSAL